MSVQAATATPTQPDRGAEEGRLGSRSAWLLGVCCVAQFMVILDLSIVNVALPHIQSGLEFTSPELQWVVDAYAISFAGFLMFGGRAADHFGQRRTFVAALLLFALASLAGGLASSRAMLVGARAVQGFGGALMAACSLAVITSSFAPGRELNRAIGTWAAMNGLGGSAGVLFGGIITEGLTWRWILLINPPIAVAAALVAYTVVSQHRRENGPSFDLAGALTLTIGQMVLVYGVVEAGLAGWSSPAALGPILGGIALLVVFGVIETRFASAPLIPFKELTKPLRNANNIVLLFSATLFPLWFVSSLYLQQVLDLSALNTGLTFLPMTLVIMLVASRAGRLVSHFGVRSVLGGGLVMLTGGLLLLARIGSSGSPILYVMLPGLLVAAGIAMSIVPSTIAATQGAKPGQTGLASGLVNTSRQIGGGLGLAVLITLATQHTTSEIGAGKGVPQALTDGFRLAFLIGAGLAGAAALLTFVSMPRAEAALRPAVRRLSIAIGLVVVGFVAADLAFAGSPGAPIGAYTLKGAYSFQSAPGLHPPKIRVTRPTDSSSLAPGYIFTADFYSLNEPPMIGQSGPLILDSHLQPVWFDPLPEKVVASNLSLQSYQGKPTLAWWQGVVTKTGSTESGEDVLANRHYQPIARLRGADGWVITLHELAVQGEDAWVTANRNFAMDLSKYGGAYNGAMIDSAVQEYNLRTGKLLYNWDALHHIGLSDSYATLPTNGFPWDAYHVNSVQLVGGDRFLVSMRNTWAAYLVNIKTGKIEWTLGGRHSSFKFGRSAAFQWQHDVVLHGGAVAQTGGTSGSSATDTAGASSSSATSAAPSSTTLTLFDDHCCQLTGGGTNVKATGPSRGLVLKLDLSTHTAALAAQYIRASSFAADYMGDTQPLAGGNVFVGWGSEPYFSEYSGSGRLLLDAELPWPDLTYRATLESWVGLPLSPPAGAARSADGLTTVYASWNGATRVASWEVLSVADPAPPSSGSRAATHPIVVAKAVKSGFETAIPLPRSLPASPSSFEVRALDGRGRAIGTSKPFTAGDQ
jgi:EmrB/QacA subfamily drug resistance transporter